MQNLIYTARGFLKSLLNSAIRLVTKPGEFFRTMPKSGGMIEPMAYIILTVWLDVILVSVETFFSQGLGINNLVMMTGALIIVPLIAIILSFFVSGIFYAAWSFMGSRENYETGYRCIAYLHIVVPITILLSLVPYLGLLGIAWWLYLMAVSTKEVHQLPIKPALLVFGGIAILTGLIYYSAVTSSQQSQTRLHEFTRDLQKMPTKSRY